MEIDLYCSDNSYIKINQEWHTFKASCLLFPRDNKEVQSLESESFVYGVEEHYGCESGCTVYCVYLAHKDESKKEKLICREFIRDSAIKKAEECSKKHGDIPIVLFTQWS